MQMIMLNNCRAISEFVIPEGIQRMKDNHAPTILSLQNKLLVAWYAGEYEGDRSVGIWLSEKSGFKWGIPKKIVGSGMKPCWNPVLFQMKNNRILLFYKEGFDIKKWESKYIFSDDEGKTWSSPIPLKNNLYGPVKNKPIYKENVILCGTSSEENGWQAFFSATTNLEDWTITKPSDGNISFQVIQPTILNHNNGALQAILRTKHGKLAECWSFNGGKTWSKVLLTDIQAVNSGIDGVVLKDGRALIVVNAYNEKMKRNKLIVLTSKNGSKWRESFILEDHFTGEYSYPSVIQDTNNMIHFVYTYDRKNIRHVQLPTCNLR